MINRPDKKPRFATGGSAAVTEPSESKKDLGWIAEKPPHQTFNWLHEKTHEWVEYLESLSKYPSEIVNRIMSGNAKTSGYPSFLEAGGAGNDYFKILGASTNLEMVINTLRRSLTSDLQSSNLALAPGSNNTCLVNDTGLASYLYKETIGEHGYWINIDTIGSEITALNGTVQVFNLYNGTDNEKFIAHVDTTNGYLIPIRRGVGGTSRITFANNDVITLLKAHYIFLDEDLSTIDTTATYPSWGYSAPGSPATGDYWNSSADNKWYEWSGSAWVEMDRIYLGYAICDSADCLWVEPEDFSLNWDGILEGKLMYPKSDTEIVFKGGIRTSVAGKPIIINDDVVVDITSDLISGETESSLTWYYVYCDDQGQFYLSSVAPRAKDAREGWYHPSEYYRCVGMAFNDGSSNLTGSKYDFSAKSLSINTTTVSGGITTPTSFAKYSFYTPPIVKTAEMHVETVATSAQKVEARPVLPYVPTVQAVMVIAVFTVTANEGEAIVAGLFENGMLEIQTTSSVLIYYSPHLLIVEF